ncbi:MAG: methylisocitrate lyase [Fimbriimonadaceae bacterium]|jgi:methylisocitrate lyase|nr:methylisocitrate lyase [Fimbriimonadaceae bacterium]
MLQPPLTSPGNRLRELIKNDTVVMPGVFNAISAVSAHKAGARALYLSGAGITNGTLGLPDIALATLTEFAQIATYVCQVAGVPVISDADTGFGESLNVMRTVIEMERAGLAGIHIEDQVNPKRCGHLDGKTVIPAEEMARKLRAAVDSKKDPNFMIIARTDARGVEGLESAIERAKCYVGAGADAIFPEGLASEAEFEAFRKGVSVPLMANMTEFGKTPIIPAARFKDLGYEMVIYPMTAFRVMLKALDECYSELLKAGTQAGIMDRMRTRAELYDRIEYAAYEAKDREWAEEAQKR